MTIKVRSPVVKDDGDDGQEPELADQEKAESFEVNMSRLQPILAIDRDKCKKLLSRSPVFKNPAILKSLLD